MVRITVSMVVGLAGGILLGSLAAYCLHPTGEFLPLPGEGPRWTSYPTIAESVGLGNPVLTQNLYSAGDFRYWLFFGVVCGGGFGMVTGSVVGATAILAERLGRLPAPK